MNFKEIQNKLDDYEGSGYYILESFLLQILKLEAKSNKQELQLNGQESSNLYFDAYAPSGLGDIPGPLSIEIIQTLSLSRLKKFEAIKNPVTNLLIISLKDSTATSDLKNLVSEGLYGKLYIWGVDQIQNLLEKHSELASNLSERMFSIWFERAISNTTDNWLEKRKDIISEVNKHYKFGRFSLFLGAGVSSSAGLPDWDTLLNSLLVSMLTNEDGSDHSSDYEKVSSIVKRLRTVDGPSTLTLARYIRKGSSVSSESEQNKFISSMTQQLYGSEGQTDDRSSTLIKAITSLCTPSRTGAKIKSVVTYNFDDLLERELKRHGLVFRSIFEEIDLPSPEELPIYHVHGFLPENRDQYPNIEKATLVFSEEGYHQIYGEAYHWSNLIQLNSLKETSCLMIGLSLTDPNLRRLLEISAKSMDKPKHFAFLKRLNYAEFSKEGNKSVVSAPERLVRTFLDKHHSLNEGIMKELGVNIIWYEDYSDIPKLIGEISNSVN